MSHRWSNSAADNGILRKHDANEKKDDILVFGYSCKLFRDDEKALYIDQGKHLIPWMGDAALKIDRYDCRGNMGHSELNLAEAKVDGVNWLQLLSSEEQRAEKLCDEERYRALYTNEDEEEMYREEELKRLHMKARGSSYGQVQFNYEGDSGEAAQGQEGAQEQENEMDYEPFIPSPHLNLPEGMPIPENKKLNAIIEKTAMFIANQGVQMEILLKAKQAGNPQFEFLSLECPLHRYYTHLLQAIRERRYHPHQEDKPPEKPEEEDHYLHPSLAPVSVESAPSIPSIAYKPTADCAYSMLVNQIKGKDPKQEDNASETLGLEESDIAPPGTEVLPLPIPKQHEHVNSFSKMNSEQLKSYASYSFGIVNPDIAKGPVMYTKESEKAPVSCTLVATTVKVDDKVLDGFDSNVSSPRSGSTTKVGPLKLIHYSDSDSASDSDSGSVTFPRKPTILQPSPEQQLIIDKMASYVAKNGDSFEQIVKMKGDPRFSFLNASHEHYPYYKNKRQFYEGVNRKEAGAEMSDKSCDDFESKAKGPVSFSIKKMKEPEPILPKPALPYESTTDEDNTDNENSRDSIQTKQETKQQNVVNKSIADDALELLKRNPVQTNAMVAKPIIPPIANPIVAVTVPTAPKPVLPVPKPVPAVSTKPLPIIQPMPFIAKSSTVKAVPTNVSMVIDPKTIYHVQNDVQPIDKRMVVDKMNMPTVNKYPEPKRSKSKEKKVKRDKSPRPERNSCEEDGRERRRKQINRRSRSPRRKMSDDVIMLEDDDVSDKGTFIDLTEEDRMGYKKDSRDRDRDRLEELDSDDNDAQSERKRKAAAFLSSLRDIPTLATQQQSTLASAMVKTLHSYHNKRREEERGRKKKSKKHKRSRSKSYSSGSERDERRLSSYSRRHHKSKHWKKHRTSCREESSSKGRSSSKRKSSPRYERDSKSHERADSSRKKLKTTEEQYKPKRHNDKLLTTSLKELVKETRKDFIAREPIKMAVDIFSEKPTKRVTGDDEWEETSNRSSQEDSESGEISSSSSTSDDE